MKISMGEDTITTKLAHLPAPFLTPMMSSGLMRRKSLMKRVVIIRSGKN